MHRTILTVILFRLAVIETGSVALTRGRSSSKNPCKGRPDGSFAANPKGCNFFFYCRNEKGVEAYCPNGMWFNSDSGICDQPENVECHFNDPPPTQSPTNDDEAIVCPKKDARNVQFMASGVDCGRYYICYHGRAIRRQCISDFHWNVRDNQCDYPDIAKCQVNLGLEADISVQCNIKFSNATSISNRLKHQR